MSPRLLWPALALVALAYFAFPNANVDFTRYNADDSGFYLALAESLADGRGYTFYQAPLFAPSNIWPPAFPLGLSFVVRLFGLDLLALKISMVLLGLATLLATYRFFTRVRPTPWALTIAALTAVSPLFFSFSHQIMADAPILLCILLALASLDRWLRLGCPLGGRPFWLAVAAVTLAYATKLQAVVLVAVPIVHYLVHRKAAPSPSARRIVVFCFAASLGFVAWTARGVWLERSGFAQGPQVYYVTPVGRPDAAGGSGTLVALDDAFGRPVTETLRAAVDNARWRLIPNLAELVVPPLSLTAWRSAPGWAILLLSAVLLLPVGVGWIQQCRARETVLSSFYGLQLFTILVATTFTNPRYLVCLIPFTSFYFLIGAEALCARRKVVTGLATALLVLGVVALVVHLAESREHPYATPAQADFVAAADWSKSSLEPDAAILGHNWSELHVLSGHATYPMLSPPGVSREPWLEIARRPIYVLVPKAEALAAISARDKCPPVWRHWLEQHPDERQVVFDNTYYRIERLQALPLDVILQ